MKGKHPFTDSELLVYLEVARLALGDADIFDGTAMKMDLSDQELIRLRNKLWDWLGEEKP